MFFHSIANCFGRWPCYFIFLPWLSLADCRYSWQQTVFLISELLLIRLLLSEHTESGDVCFQCYLLSERTFQCRNILASCNRELVCSRITAFSLTFLAALKQAARAKQSHPWVKLQRKCPPILKPGRSAGSASSLMTAGELLHWRVWLCLVVFSQTRRIWVQCSHGTISMVAWGL